MAFGMILLCTSGKLHANYLMGKSLYVNGIDFANLPVLKLFMQYFWLDLREVPLGVFFGPWFFGPWEWTGVVSKGTLPLILISIIYLLREKRSSLHKLALFSCFLCGCFILILTAGTRLNSHLPFLN